MCVHIMHVYVMHMCVHVCVFVCMHVCVRMRACACLFVWCVCVRTCMYAFDITILTSNVASNIASQTNETVVSTRTPILVFSQGVIVQLTHIELSR